MTLEIRPTDSPESFDLFDETGKVGEIVFVPEHEEYGGTNLASWEVALWSMTGSGSAWLDGGDTLAKAEELAQSLYPELVAERRRVNSPGPGPRVRVISTPMGGQRRR